jgi:hypothetical protein
VQQAVPPAPPIFQAGGDGQAGIDKTWVTARVECPVDLELDMPGTNAT